MGMCKKLTTRIAGSHKNEVVIFKMESTPLSKSLSKWLQHIHFNSQFKLSPAPPQTYFFTKTLSAPMQICTNANANTTISMHSPIFVKTILVHFCLLLLLLFFFFFKLYLLTISTFILYVWFLFQTELVL
jgi:hypothetical protein